MDFAPANRAPDTHALSAHLIDKQFHCKLVYRFGCRRRSMSATRGNRNRKFSGSIEENSSEEICLSIAVPGRAGFVFCAGADEARGCDQIAPVGDEADR